MEISIAILVVLLLFISLSCKIKKVGLFQKSGCVFLFSVILKFTDCLIVGCFHPFPMVIIPYGNGRATFIFGSIPSIRNTTIMIFLIYRGLR